MKAPVMTIASMMVAAASAVLAPPMGAQLPVTSAMQPEQATFVLLVNADTLVVEHSTRTATQLSGEIVIRGQGVRVVYHAVVAADATIPEIETAFYRGADTLPARRAQVEMRGDTALARVGTTVQALRTAAGALPMPLNVSSAFLEQVVLRARAIGGEVVELPVFHLVGGLTTPTTVRMLRNAGGAGRDSATIDMPGVQVRLALRADGRVTGGVVPSQRARIARVDGHITLGHNAPDYSAPAGAPYTAEEVRITTPAGIRLSGTLTLPRLAARERAPAIVTITGSGGQSRDGVSAGLSAYRPFRELADTLSRRGIAVLRLDDRGVGGSDMGPLTVTSADFADDVRAALAYLRAHSRVDGARLGLVGHSEGGIIAPMVAATDSALRAVVVMAGTARPGRLVLPHQQRYAVDSIARLTGAARDSALAASARATDSLAARLPWMRFFLDYDPAVAARRVRAPVLILHGDEDQQVPVSEARLLAGVLRAGGNRDVTVRTFAATNHLFVPHGDGGFDYARLPSLQVRAEVLGAAADWLVRVLR